MKRGDPGRARRGGLVAVAPIALLLGLFFVLKAYAFSPIPGDEYTYVYMAQLTAEGFLPYRDFFFGHPPLHLVPGVLVALASGSALEPFRALPMLAAAVGAFFVWRLVRREVRAIEAVIAAALFLFSFDLLRCSTHYTAIDEAIALLAVGFDAILARRDRTAGAAFACAALTGFYVAPVALGMVLVRALEDRRSLRPLIVTGAAVFVAVNAVGLALAGGAYLDQVYFFHLRKPEHEGEFWTLFSAVARDNAALVWSPVMALAALAVEWRRRGPAAPSRRAVTVAFASVAASVPFLLGLRQVAVYYFLISFPALAVLGGFGYGGIVRALRSAWSGTRGRAVVTRAVMTAVILGFVAVGSRVLPDAGRPDPTEDEASGPATKTYEWKDSPLLPAWANAGVRAIFWSDARVSRRQYDPIRRYLWHESRGFEAAPRLVAEIERRTPRGASLFGDSSSVPLLALLSGRRVALDDPDTKSVRFRSGATPPGVMIARLERDDPPEMVLVRPSFGFIIVPEFERWILAHYDLVEDVKDPIHGSFLLLVRRRA